MPVTRVALVLCEGTLQMRFLIRIVVFRDQERVLFRGSLSAPALLATHLAPLSLVSGHRRSCHAHTVIRSSPVMITEGVVKRGVLRAARSNIPGD